MQTNEVTAMAVDVMDKRRELYLAQEADTSAVYTLEDEKARAYVDGRISGKNDKERDASAAVVLAELIGAQRVTKAKVEYAKMNHDRAVMNWERVKYTVRLLEVNKA